MMHRKLLMNAIWQGYRRWITVTIFVGIQLLVVSFIFNQWWIAFISIVGMASFAWALQVVRWQARYLHQHQTVAQTAAQLLIDTPSDTPVTYLAAAFRENIISFHQAFPAPLTVIDLYNPQLMRMRQIGRIRHQSHKHTLTTRNAHIDWRVGRIDLLPLPDNHVQLLVVDQLLTALSDVNNRTILLNEIARVLAPNGQLIVIEKTETAENEWTLGMMGLTYWKTVPAWKHLLSEHGYHIADWKKSNQLLFIFKAINQPSADVVQNVE